MTAPLPTVRRTALVVGACVLALSFSAGAHERKTAGAVTLVIGWGDEPAFTGARNSVVVLVSDRNGPIKAPAVLSAEISFGSERMTVPLEPVASRPGEYQAWLVPTRPGTYAFHISGTVGTQNIDVTSTCSESTFHCVVDATDIQFPAKDPSIAQLADRVERGLPRAERATDAAAGATRLSFAALAISIAGTAIALAVGWRSRKTGP